jgi:hypothetical protein
MAKRYPFGIQTKYLGMKFAAESADLVGGNGGMHRQTTGEKFYFYP